MVRLRLFGPARDLAGTTEVEVEANDVAEVIAWTHAQFSVDFARLLERSRIWVNGETSEPSRTLEPGDEVAIVPPVSGG